MLKSIRRRSIIYTDKFRSYDALMFCGYRHLRVDHGKRFASGKVYINGLIRQYFPKGTNFTKVTPQTIKWVERELNDRPRKVLHWKKPDEMFNQLVPLKV